MSRHYIINPDILLNLEEPATTRQDTETSQTTQGRYHCLFQMTRDRYLWGKMSAQKYTVPQGNTILQNQLVISEVYQTGTQDQREATTAADTDTLGYLVAVSLEEETDTIHKPTFHMEEEDMWKRKALWTTKTTGVHKCPTVQDLATAV